MLSLEYPYYPLSPNLVNCVWEIAASENRPASAATFPPELEHNQSSKNSGIIEKLGDNFGQNLNKSRLDDSLKIPAKSVKLDVKR